MFTEDWKPRYNNGQNGDGQNRERRPYNSNRPSYGNQGSYGRPDNRNNYNNRQGSGSYDRQGSGNYDRQNFGGYDRQNSGGYDRQNSGNYDRPRPNYNNNYSPRPYDDYSGEGMAKKRRPRVGEVSTPMRSSGYDNRRTSWQQDSYSRPQRPQQRPAKPAFGQSKYGTPKQSKYREENFDPNEQLRLNKYLANAGVCSRREADEFIKAGLVKVNGEPVTELGTKVRRADEVTFHNEPVKLEHKIYLLLNKPRNCVTTADDPQERLTVMDLVKTACQERIFPVGRLDRNTTGVLLLTNDGDLSAKLTHPKFLKKKIYHVWLDKDVDVEDMQKLADGIELEDGEIHADAISYVTDETKDQVGIEIHSGRNRIVRRMFESLGYHVMKLDRVYFAGLTKKNLKKGHWRFLSDQEVNILRMGAFD
ncbi:pseudouridine synthase [Bacteroidia bacterium]|nr:pseudouridine synthase [Bacteroidia bacterium]